MTDAVSFSPQDAEAVKRDREATASAFDALAALLAHGEGFDALADRAAQQATAVREDSFTIIVVGEFKRGKSTVINAMLGAVVLPSKVSPASAIASRVRYGDEPRATIFFKDPDRASEVLRPEEFRKHYQLSVSDTKIARDDEDEARSQEIEDRFGHVDHSVIEFPSPLLANGVVIADTPGLNDRDDRTRRALAELPAADAIIFVLDAVHVVNQHEIDFIEQRLRPHGLNRNTFFLLNGWDILESRLLDPTDGAERAEMFRDQHAFIDARLAPFASAGGVDKVDKRIFRTNALGALKSRIRNVPADDPDLSETALPAFEAALMEFLTTERYAVKRAKAVKVATDIASEHARLVDTLINKALAPLDDIDRERAQLASRLKQLERVGDNIQALFAAQAAELGEVLGNQLETFLDEKLFDRLDKSVSRLDLGPIGNIVKQWSQLGDFLRSEERKVSKQIERHLNTEIERMLSNHLQNWRETYLEPTLKQSISELESKLRNEAQEYVRILDEIRDGETGGPTREGEIAAKIQDWLSSRGSGVVIDPKSSIINLAPLLVAVSADIGLYVMMNAANFVLPGVGLLASAVLAVVRAEGAKKKARQKIAERLAAQRREFILSQRVTISDGVREAFEKVAKPIDEQISAEIYVIRAGMEDLIARRHSEAFDAEAFVQTLRKSGDDVREQVQIIQAACAAPP